MRSEDFPAYYPEGTEGSPQGTKRPEREFDRAPPNSTEAKNTWIYTSAHLHIFIA
jgi:hypothetical protein